MGKNILFVMVDQLYAEAMSHCTGDQYLNTPVLDRLAAESRCFTKAYTASPVCIPARNAIFTGLYPHQTGIECNRSHPRNPLPAWPQGDEKWLTEHRFMGQYFRDAGYDTAYFGKWHLNVKPEDKDRHGFKTTGVIENIGHDPEIATAAAQYLRQQHGKPFIAVVSFCDPHDICQYADGRPLPGGALPDPLPETELPPAVPNAAVAADEGDILSSLREAYYVVHVDRRPESPEQRQAARELRWAYYRLIERVDALIGQVLDALRESGQDENTVVVFTSDHGELQGAHGLVQKTFFFEEAVHVPFFVRAPGSAAGKCEELINGSIDVLPTILDYAAIPVPDALPGRTVRPLVELRTPEDPRNYVIGQVHLCQPKMPEEIPRTYGRMVRSRRYSYWLLDQGDDREIVFDTEADPGETTNIAARPKNRSIIEQHRGFLLAHAERAADERAKRMLAAVM